MFFGNWETVFRTNTQSAYTAGKLLSWQNDMPAAIQLCVTEDSRTSKICRNLVRQNGNGIILPVNHPFWQKYGYPPYHFNCRTSIHAVYADEIGKIPYGATSAGGLNVSNPPLNYFDNFKPQQGFGGNPLDTGNWWDLTEGQRRLAEKYGLLKEFEESYKNILRYMANGQRRSVFEPLSEKEKQFVYSEAVSIGIPKEIIVFREGNVTGYLDSRDIIYISASVFPSNDGSINNRDNLSVRAVLAHEYYGHRKYRNTTLKQGSWQDEFRASYSAALNTPNLSDKDRQMLMRDALDRADEAGIQVQVTGTIRRILYGF